MTRIAFFIAALLLALPAAAQAPAPVTAPDYPYAPSGQTPGGIDLNTFMNNTDTVGFDDKALSPSVAAAGTTQATATLLTTRTSVITACAAGAGVELPSVNRFVPVAVLNRSGASCLVYPSPNATVESAPGVAAAVNAGITMATNTDLVFRPVTPLAWAQ